MTSLLRQRSQHDSGKVAMVELFFDLVFVFAITQLSHALLADLTVIGAARVALMMFAVWWAWIYTSWVTNWLDPEKLPVRASLFALMLLGLVISCTIPKAFAERGIVFAGAYAAFQVGRTLSFLWAVRSGTPVMIRNFQRILVWLCVAAGFWIAGGLSDGIQRMTLWLIALGIEFMGPIAFFWVPGLGRSRIEDWDVDANHMAERCGLFVIISLGESILVTGATFAELSWNITTISAFLVAVVGSLALWWIYFDTGATRGHHRMLKSSDPGRQARIAYTYMHALIVAGVVVCAVADEVGLAHPDHLTESAIAVILGGPALYLLGNALFKWVTNDRAWPPISHVAGMVLLALLLIPALMHVLSPLVLAALATLVLVIVAYWESVALRRNDTADRAAAH